MSAPRRPPTVGVVAALAVIAVLAVPYALVPGGSGVGTYYAAGAVNGLVAGLFAAVSIVVFAAGREERSDPALVAGVGLVLGGFATIFAVLWAVTVPVSIVQQLGTNSLVGYHRGALVLAAAGLPASAGWYARRLGVL